MRDFFVRWAASVLALLLVVVAAPAAMAQSYEAALAKFAANSFNDTDAGIAGVAASGNPLAIRIITALQDGKLFFSPDDKKVYFREGGNDALVDAATGKPVAGAPPANLSPVRVNNRLRRSIEAALGGLTLLSADAEKRFEAAQAVFKSKDTNQLANLDAALAKETDARVKRAFTEARAAVVLNLDSSKSPTRSRPSPSCATAPTSTPART